MVLITSFGPKRPQVKHKADCIRVATRGGVQKVLNLLSDVKLK